MEVERPANVVARLHHHRTINTGEHVDAATHDRGELDDVFPRRGHFRGPHRVWNAHWLAKQEPINTLTANLGRVSGALHEPKHKASNQEGGWIGPRRRRTAECLKIVDKTSAGLVKPSSFTVRSETLDRRDAVELLGTLSNEDQQRLDHLLEE